MFEYEQGERRKRDERANEDEREKGKRRRRKGRNFLSLLFSLFFLHYK